MTTALTVSLALAALSGCSGGSSPSDGMSVPAATTAPAGRPFIEYDVIAMASDENNLGFADLYGIDLDSLEVSRITVNKRISSLDANAEQIVVAAADQQVDRLGLVEADGSIAPIPSLGRPFAYTPLLGPGDTVIYSDFVERRDGSNIDRIVRWNPANGARTVLHKSDTEMFSPELGPEGSLAALSEDSKAIRFILGSYKGRSTRLPYEASVLHWGRRLIATSAEGGRTDSGFDPTGTQLIDPKSGNVRQIKGWDPIAWSPEGRTLLVRDSSDLVNSTLAVLDPEAPNDPRVLGTLPQLTLYSGVWVRNAPGASPSPAG